MTSAFKPSRSIKRTVFAGLALVSVMSEYTAARAARADTLVVNASDDAYTGSPSLTVPMDGTQADDTQAATTPQASNASPNVFIGGDVGFTNLTTRGVSGLLATGRGGVYLHGSAVSAATAAVDRAILTAFRPYGSGVFEAGQNTFFNQGDAYDSYLAASGWVPQSINLNLNGPVEGYSASNLASVKTWMNRVRSRSAFAGATIAPIATPGGNVSALGGKFSATDSVWGNLAKACLYGRAIAIDIPATNFVNLGAGWPEFIESQIKWGIANGIRTSVIFSPGNSPTFVEDVAAAVAKLVAANAIPTDYSVENYTGAGATIAAVENRSESLNAAALWLAKNAPVAAHK
ncbi:MAG: hypothetical protein ACRYGI_13085 [Janthinobacterium lividum]